MSFKLYILIKKEVLQFFRNIPLLVIVLYACTLDVYMAGGLGSDLQNYPIAIYDLDKTPKSQKLIETIREPYFKIYGMLNDEKEIDELILRGDVGVVLVIPKNFQNDINSRRGATVQIILDATNSGTAELVANYLYSITSDYSSKIIVKEWKYSKTVYKMIPVMDVSSRFEYNETLKTEWTMCLQEFFTILTLIAILLPATAMVNEKQFGTIEQLMVTPLRPWEIMLAKVLPMVGIFIIASFICIYCILIPVIGVPLRGSIIDFLILTVMFCFASSGLGLLISTVSNNLSETVLLTLLTLFPIMFLSGATVPPEAMPSWMQWLIQLSPLKYYLDMGVAIFLKGNSLLFMWKQFLGLVAIGLGIFWLGAVRFKKMFG
ncbi:MAG: ABC transporter permease [Firmicutes bacterium]|nr:ABC transporter permease [Bacillota bacterium]